MRTLFTIIIIGIIIIILYLKKKILFFLLFFSFKQLRAWGNENSIAGCRQTKAVNSSLCITLNANNQQWLQQQQSPTYLHGNNNITEAIIIKTYTLLAIIKLNCFYHTHCCCCSCCCCCAAFVLQLFVLLLLLLFLHYTELIWVDFEVVQKFRCYIYLSMCVCVCVCRSRCVRAAICVPAIYTPPYGSNKCLLFVSLHKSIEKFPD